jgi:hypothetical protein
LPHDTASAGVAPERPPVSGARVGDLDEVIVTAFRHAEDLLELRFGLQQEVLGRAAAEDDDARLAARLALRVQHQRRHLGHVRGGIQVRPALGRRRVDGRQVQADGRVARRRHPDRQVEVVRGCQQRRLLHAQLARGLQRVLADQMMQLRSRDPFAELGRHHHAVQPFVSLVEDVGGKQHVVDSG